MYIGVNFLFLSRNSARSYYSRPPFLSSFLAQRARGKGARPSGPLSHTITPMLLCSALRLRLFGKIPNPAPLTFSVSPDSSLDERRRCSTSGERQQDRCRRRSHEGYSGCRPEAPGGGRRRRQLHLSIWPSGTPTRRPAHKAPPHQACKPP
jgi:hypothetical protein